MEYKNAEHSIGSKELAYYIINAMNKHTPPQEINETKIQKLTYLVYGFYLGLTGECIINDEKPKARPYGPVFPRVSKIFKKNNMSDFEKYTIDSIQDKQLQIIIGKILDTFGGLSASKLVTLMHLKNTPRSKTKEKEDFVRNDVIEDSLTYEYFKK